MLDDKRAQVESDIASYLAKADELLALCAEVNELRTRSLKKDPEHYEARQTYALEKCAHSKEEFVAATEKLRAAWQPVQIEKAIFSGWTHNAPDIVDMGLQMSELTYVERGLRELRDYKSKLPVQRLD